MKLSLAAEEVAVFFAQMLDHEYTTKEVFRENFFKDWRKVKNKKIIKNPKCRTNLTHKNECVNYLVSGGSETKW